MAQKAAGITIKDILTDKAIRNAMVIHAAFGGSTNLLLHLPAIAHSAGLKLPSVEDWEQVNRQVVRLVDVLPNGPAGHPTVRVFLAGGVPEVMLQLRSQNLLDLSVLTATGITLEQSLEEWESSERRTRFRSLLQELDGVNPEEVIYTPESATRRGLTSTMTFCRGNLAPEGSVVKSTSIDPTVIDRDGVYRKTGPARIFIRETAAIEAIKNGSIQSGDIMVLICCGPLGSGMEEIYQITSTLRHLRHGKQVAVITDARFSGVSAGACIGHIGPEALAGGPVGKLIEGDILNLEIDCKNLTGRIDLVGHNDQMFEVGEGEQVLAGRSLRTDLSPHPSLPAETRLWAAMQACSGGTWTGCVYDVDAIVEAIDRGTRT